jgi:hypothetical protein
VLLWVPFRLETLGAVGIWLRAMFGGSGFGSVEPLALVAVLVFLLLANLPRPQLILRPVPVVALLLLSLFVGYGRLGYSPFLYFRF